MKLYLAHPLPLRAKIREIELRIEEELGIELLNPFYDTGRDSIQEIDAGKKTRDDESLNFITLVEKDIANVHRCDGVLAYIEKSTHSIGTFCELWEAVKHNMPIFIVSPDCSMHPWVRYMTWVNDGVSFQTFEEFITYFKEEKGGKHA